MQSCIHNDKYFNLYYIIINRNIKTDRKKKKLFFLQYCNFFINYYKIKIKEIVKLKMNKKKIKKNTDFYFRIFFIL